jgi:hypothetical protein
MQIDENDDDNGDDGPSLFGDNFKSIRLANEYLMLELKFGPKICIFTWSFHQLPSSSSFRRQ